MDLVVNQNQPTVSFANAKFEPLQIQMLRHLEQVTVELEVCGAAGQTVTLTSTRTGGWGADEVPGGTECSTISMPAVNVPLGSVTMTASVTDLCGGRHRQPRLHP